MWLIIACYRISLLEGTTFQTIYSHVVNHRVQGPPQKGQPEFRKPQVRHEAGLGLQENSFQSNITPALERPVMGITLFPSVENSRNNWVRGRKSLKSE